MKEKKAGKQAQGERLFELKSGGIETLPIMLQTDKAGEMPLSGLGSFISYEVRASTTRVLSLIT